MTRKIRWEFEVWPGEFEFKTGTVVHQEGDWLVVRTDGLFSSQVAPFIVKRTSEVEPFD